MPDCSVHAACLCPWREPLALGDLSALPEETLPKKAARCPGQEECEWHVAEGAKGLAVYHSRPDYRRDPMPVAPWPKVEAPAWTSRATRHVVRVDDGWVVAFNAGEFGAGTWWVSADGKRNQYIGKHHVVALINTRVGVLAATGIDHMVEGHGDVFLIENAKGKGWRERHLADIGASAYTATATAGGEAILVVTRTQLVKVSLDGKVTLLHTGRWDASFDYGPRGISGFYPGSVTAALDGSIWIGMRAAIVRLTRVGSGYKEEWLGPKTCPEAGSRPTSR
jgi:hypothetical protein